MPKRDVKVTKEMMLGYLDEMRRLASRDMATSCPFQHSSSVHRLCCELKPLLRARQYAPNSVIVEVEEADDA